MNMETNKEISQQPKKSRKWYIRGVAMVLAIIMIVSIAMNRSVSLDVAEMKAASFKEQGENVTMDTGSIEEKMKALEEVNELQKRLNDDYSKAMEYIGNGQLQEAIEPIKELLNNIDDENVSAYLRATLAEIYYTVGEYFNCAKSCEIIINKGNDTQGTYQFMRGICLLQENDLEGCIENLEKALEAGYPEVGLCKTQIALAAVNSGDYEKALTASKEALEADHDESLDQTLYYISAMAHLQTAAYEEAIEDLNILLKEDKSNSEFLNYRGIAYMALEKYDKAAADFKKSIDKGNKDIGSLYNYGICSIMSEDYENGLEALQKVVDRNENKDYTKGAKDLINQINTAIAEAEAQAQEEAQAEAEAAAVAEETVAEQ